MASIYKNEEDTKNMRTVRPHYYGDVNALVSSYLKGSQDKGLFLATDGMIGPGIVNTFVDGAIGAGLALEAAPDRRFLKGISENTINRNMEIIEAHYDLITSTPELCDWSQKMDFSEIMRIAVRGGLSTGDFLAGYKVRKVGDTYYPALQTIDGRNIRNPNFAEDTPQMIAGVELVNGIETAYNIATYKDSLLNEKFERVVRKKDGMLMYDLVRFGIVQPGQIRGRSILLPVFDRILDIKRYSAAELVKAIVQSSIPFFITVAEQSQPTQNPDRSNVLKNIQDSQTTATGQVVNDPIKIEAAYVNQLNPGEKIEFPESKAPVSQFWQFMEAQIKLIAMDIGIAPTVLLKAFRSNYSASQAEIQDAARGFDILRQYIIRGCVQNYYNLHVELLARQKIVNLPGFFEDPLIRRAWCTASWYGPAIMNIDPVKNANASIALIQNGLSTRQKEARKVGNDFEDNVVALQAEQKLIQKHGVKIGGPVVQEEEEEEEETPTEEGEENAQS
jgi:lambda family phage portal protein